MRPLAFIGLLLINSGCWCADVYLKTETAWDCIMDKHTSYCAEAKTDRDKSICFNDLQNRCVHAAVHGESTHDISPDTQHKHKEKLKNK